MLHAIPVRRRVLAAVVSLMLASHVYAEESVVKNPHHGPYSQPIASVATWQVDKGFVSLDPDDTTRLMEKMQNPGVTDTWLYAPDDIDRWFAIVSYEQTGHVKDDEKIDADAILETLKEGTKEGNEERRKRGWQELNLLGWQVQPHYEPDTKRLSWATLSESGGSKTVNYTTKVLSRTGVATVVLVTDPAHLDQAVSELKGQLNSFKFNTGENYTEFRDGDKIAEYGLTGLIVGGAAAAALKAGGWKWLVGILAAGWKVVVGVGVAALAGLRSLFSRKKS